MLMNVSEVLSSPGSEPLQVCLDHLRFVHRRFDIAHPQKEMLLSRSVLPTWDSLQMQKENKTYKWALSKQQCTFISLNNCKGDYKFKPPRSSCWKMMKSMFEIMFPSGHAFQHMSTHYCEHNYDKGV